MVSLNIFNPDAFSAGQMQSKIWLVQRLEDVLLDNLEADNCRILLLAGWYGVTNLLIRTRKRIPVDYVRSVDIDPSCKIMAEQVNNLWHWQNGQFQAIVADVNEFDYTKDDFNVVINTSVEHLESNEWFYNIPKGTIVCLQGSNMEDEDHVNKIQNARELLEKYPMSELLYEGIKLFNFDGFQFYRSMIIGIK